MTTKTIERALKRSKPSILKENGRPRFVILDWDTYRRWEETKEDLEDTARLAEALVDPKNKKLLPLSQVKKMLRLP
jgi:PHD/YefM family antitoxin component YafN of YafNO toxin-antitoxin module